MAIPFLNNINLSDNQLQNAKLHVTSGTPTAATGQIYYNSTSNVVLVYDNAGWETVAFQSWATDQFLEDSEVSTFAKSILDDADAEAVRTTIGAGTSNLTLGTTSTTALAGDTVIPSGNQIIDWTIDQGSTNIHTGNYNNTQLSDSEVVAAIVASTSISTSDQSTFRSNIGAGTSSLTLGTTSTTALAGNTIVNDVSVENLKTALAGGFSSNAVQIGDSTDTVTIPGDLVVTGTNNVETVSTSNGVVFEGTTNDGFDGTLFSTVSGSSKTYTLPNLTGHVALFATAPTATITSTPAELNILDGATVTTSELNILDGVTATASELNILDGATVSTSELNILDGVTATTSELNILDGVTATASELNKLDGVTSTTAELNILDGVTATATELNILDGVTSTTAELNILDGVTATAAEINLLDGVTSLAHTGKKTKKISGDGTTTTFSLSHGLNTAFVSVEILDYGDNSTGATYERVFADVIATSGSETSSIDVSFGTAPSTTQDYVVLISSFPAIS